MRAGSERARRRSWGRGWTVSVTVASVVRLCQDRSYAAGDLERPVVVLVDDRARVQPHILDLAEKQATRIYKQAGAKMVWRSAQEPVVNAGFTVRLVIQAEFRGASPSASPFLMGAAPDTTVECGGVAYLFFDQITAFSNIMLRDAALVLGTVAAHEVGHVLLRRQGHSTEGLMRASWKPDDWDRAASGFLLFSPPERMAVRKRISDCREGG
jgi:hypothetical protein